MNLLFIDVETTGKDPLKNDLIEVAGIQKVDGEIVNKFCIKCRPFFLENVSEEALRVNGYSLTEIKNFPSSRDAYSEFKKNIMKQKIKGSYNIVAHNASFDKTFLYYWLIKGDKMGLLSKIDFNSEIDTLAIAKFLRAHGIIKNRFINLGALCKHYKIPHADKHTATGDVEALYLLYDFLLRDMENCFIDMRNRKSQMTLF